jgi:hypothetical protein
MASFSPAVYCSGVPPSLQTERAVDFLDVDAVSCTASVAWR